MFFCSVLSDLSSQELIFKKCNDAKSNLTSRNSNALIPNIQCTSASRVLYCSMADENSEAKQVFDSAKLYLKPNFSCVSRPTSGN